MATPSVPPRPQRAQQPTATPSVPPRPVRKTDPSPDREAFTRSPLNGPPSAFHTRRASQDSRRLSADLPPRPPSVSLPSIGQEGSEYSSYDQLPTEAPGLSVTDSAEQTKSVASDLPMHQPVASVSKAAATRQIQTVTRTDSTQAAAAGIVSPPPLVREDSQQSAAPEAGSIGRHVNRSSDFLPLRSKASFSRSTTSLQQPLERTTSRPGSVHGGNDYEHGIPEIGMQVPLLAYAGDVQAPSPGPAQTPHTPGIGFFNDGSARNHTRKRSSRNEVFHPTDSYGLRHHDAERQDQFERAWASRHPEEAAREEHLTHLPRPESALSSEQLNKLVHQSTDVGFGTSANAISIPGEDVAFAATAEYSHASPQRDTLGGQSADRAAEGADERSYHLQPPHQRTKKVTGGGSVDGKVDIDEEYLGEHADGTPILAADEVIKRPGSAMMHAAIEPSAYTGDEYYESDHGQWHSNSRRNSMNPPSRGNSRPSSVHGNANAYHGAALHRFVSHEEQHNSGIGTPLEDVEEYEPLFPEDEKEGSAQQKRLFKKRPELAGHHFPSQDVWEDTPNSLQYSAEVHTPDIEREQPNSADTAQSHFETPEQEQLRRTQNPNDMTSSSKTFVKPQFKSGVLDDVHHARPGVQRFPSSDVWEDSPDSYQLTTTVGGPQEDELKEQDDTLQPGRPTIPARPNRAPKPDPSIPASTLRPSDATGQQRPTADATGPPSVPRGSKPTIPARPAAGAKIAALQAGFMNDLNNRLKLGPQAPPKKEAPITDAPVASADDETESSPPQPPRAPLADARKGRAKGPLRRKPAGTPEVGSKFGFAMSPLITVWTIDEEDELTVQDGAEETTTTKVVPQTREEKVAPPPPHLEVVDVDEEDVEEEEENVAAKPLAAPLAERVEKPATTIDGADGAELEKADAEEEKEGVAVS